MTILFSSNDILDFTGSFAINSDTAYFDATHVPYALQIYDDSLAEMASLHPEPAGDTVWYHHVVVSSSEPSNSEDGYYLDIRDAVGSLIARIDQDNRWLFARVYGDSTVSGYSYITFSAGAAQTVDVSVTVSASEVTMRVYFDGLLVSSASAENTGGRAGPRQLSFNPTDSLYGGSYNISEVIIADSDTRGARLSLLKPSEFGSYQTDWVGDVENVNDGSDLTNITTDMKPVRASVYCDDFTLGNAITSVVGVFRGSTQHGDPQAVGLFIRVGGSDYDAPVDVLDVAIETKSQEWRINPADGLPWSRSALNDAQLGVFSN